MGLEEGEVWSDEFVRYFIGYVDVLEKLTKAGDLMIGNTINHRPPASPLQLSLLQIHAPPPVLYSSGDLMLNPCPFRLPT